MLEFPCTSCGRRLRLDPAWAGKKCRCGNCGQIVQAPQAAAVASAVSSSAVVPAGPRRTPAHVNAVSVADMQTVGPTQEPSRPDHDVPPNSAKQAVSRTTPPSAELYDFLGPAQSAGEMGRLGGYRIVRVLGAGGMGVVFQAEDLQLKRPVALKAMLPIIAASLSNRQRFVLEAQAAAAIEHDHIVTIYQVGEDRGIPFIAMQLLKGESLEERLQRVGRVGLAEGLVIARQIASGLAIAHERGLIHRDIKPSNLFLVSEDPHIEQPSVNTAHLGSGAAHPAPLTAHHAPARVKILDFGLARSVAGDSQLTQGAIIGTPAYMAPEQSRALKLDGRCDLFSLGCVLYRMFSGRLPFLGDDAITTLLAVAGENPPSPHQVSAQVPPQLSQLIMNLLAKRPAQRPPSARAVIQRIHELERTLGVGHDSSALASAPGSRLSAPGEHSGAVLSPTVVETSIEPWPGERKKRRWLLAAWLGGAALVLAIATTVLVLSLVGQREGAADLEKKPPQEVSGLKPVVPLSDLDAQMQALLKSTVKDQNYVQTDMVGFTLAPAFEEVPPEGALLIGFEIGLGNVWAPNAINSVRPIFLTAKGEVLGKVYGIPTKTIVTVKARKGYAVGAITVIGALQVDWMKITFMKIDKKVLDTDETYQSDDIGPRGDRPPKTVGGSGALVVGICGKSNGNQCQALGLVLRGKIKQ